MSDDQNPAQAATQNEDTQAASLQVLTQYVRDMSFENPNAPMSLGASDTSPKIAVNANVGVRQLDAQDYEVALDFRVETKRNDEIGFIAELSYCGLFRVNNIPDENLRPVLLIEAPRQLFPFARRILSDMTRDGGFPPLLLDPIDFVALYQNGQNGQNEDENNNEPSELLSDQDN